MMKTLEGLDERIKHRPPRYDLIENLLPDSPKPNEFVVLAGPAGIGKTTYVVHMGLHLATGTEFQGLKCKKCKVGYLGFEGSEYMFEDRLAKVKQHFLEHFPNPGSYFRYEIRSPFTLEKKRDEFKKIFDGCRVIIVDPLKYLVAGDYTKPQYAMAFLRLLQETLLELGASAIFPHHLKKPNPAVLIEPGDLYQLKGATEYVDAATSVLMIERKRQGHKPTGGFAHVDPNLVTLYFAKTRDAVKELMPIDMRLNKDECSFEEVSPF